MEAKIKFLRDHLKSRMGAGDLMNLAKRDALGDEVERLFPTVYIQDLPLASMTCANALKVVMDEVMQSKTFATDLQAFLQEQREALASDVVWTPELEFNMYHEAAGAPYTVLRTFKESWRLNVNVTSLPLLVGQPCKWREQKDIKTQLSPGPDAHFKERGILVRLANQTWVRPCVSSDVIVEPVEFKDALGFASAPSSKNVLALFPQHVMIGKLGQKKSFGKFGHDIKDPNFLDCFVLSTGAVVVKVGKRNALTGGLSDEYGVSFRYGQNETEFEAHALSAEEDVELAQYYDIKQPTLRDVNTVLSLKNDQGEAMLAYKNEACRVDTGVACGVVGTPSGWAVAFYDGRLMLRHAGSQRTVQLPEQPLTHILYQM